MLKINKNFIPAPSKAYIVGGTVRDMLMGTPPKDIDIVTLEDPKQTAATLAEKLQGTLIELGKSDMKIFRVVSKQQTFDIAPINGKSITEDLSRRDFSINAMALRMDHALGPVNIQDHGESLIDPHKGIQDLQTGSIRMIASANLQADPVRMLRAYRIAALLNFSITPETRCAIRANAARVKQSAGERIRDELMKLFSTPRSYHYIRQMNDTGLLTEIFPELSPLKNCTQNHFHQYDVFEHTLHAYEFLEKIMNAPTSVLPGIRGFHHLMPLPRHVALLKYTLLLHDIGKPDTRSVDTDGRIHFYHHEKISAEKAAGIHHRLRLSKQDQHYTDFIIRNHLKPLFLFKNHTRQQLTKKAMSRFFLKCDQMTKDLLVHTAADFHGKGVPKNTQQFTEFLNHITASYTNTFLPQKKCPPLINGNDLINEFHLSPSPLFSKILKHVESARFSGSIATRKEALGCVKNFLNLS